MSEWEVYFGNLSHIFVQMRLFKVTDFIEKSLENTEIILNSRKFMGKTYILSSVVKGKLEKVFLCVSSEIDSIISPFS